MTFLKKLLNFNSVLLIKQFFRRLTLEKITLADCNPGEKAIITGYKKKSDFKDKLLSMGVIKKTEIEVISVAPLGDPIKIKLKGFDLSLRKNEAKDIYVEKI